MNIRSHQPGFLKVQQAPFNRIVVSLVELGCHRFSLEWRCFPGSYYRRLLTTWKTPPLQGEAMTTKFY